MKKLALLILMMYITMLGAFAEPVATVAPEQPAQTAASVQSASTSGNQTIPLAPLPSPVQSFDEEKTSVNTPQAPAGKAATPAATAASPSPSPTPAPQEFTGSATISILFTTDIHGAFQRNAQTGVLGYSGINAIARSVPNCILVDSGDYLSSSQFLAEDSINSILELMNATGYHVAGIGETDLANGAAVVQDVKSRAAFHMLSTNVTTGIERTPLLESTKIIEIAGIKVGFFSLLNPELRLSAELQDMNDIYLEDASKTAQNSVNSLKQQGADVIIALSHMGNQEGVGVDQIAAFVSGIDYILDGHDHVEESGRFIGETMILNAGSGGKQLIQLELQFGPGKTIQSFSTTQWFYEATEALPLDENLVNLENAIVARQNEFLMESVADSKVDLKYSDDILYQSHPLGNFIADAYREKTKATVALVDAGSIAAGIGKGTVTKADILSVLPNNAAVQTKKITPKTLRTALESGLSGILLLEDGTIDKASATKRFPQISGLKIQINLNNDPGKRVVKMTLDNGVSLNLTDDRTTLTVASNVGILSGQNDYGVFEMQPVLEEYDMEGQALLDYLNYTGEYPDYMTSRIELTDSQESYVMLIVTIAVVFIFVVMILILIIKLMTRVN